jgi:hypothetical protein
VRWTPWLDAFHKEREGRRLVRPPRRWVMVGCLQGKTSSVCSSKVNEDLTGKKVAETLEKSRKQARNQTRRVNSADFVSISSRYAEGLTRRSSLPNRWLFDAKLTQILHKQRSRFSWIKPVHFLSTWQCWTPSAKAASEFTTADNRVSAYSATGVTLHTVVGTV